MLYFAFIKNILSSSVKLLARCELCTNRRYTIDAQPDPQILLIYYLDLYDDQ